MRRLYLPVLALLTCIQSSISFADDSLRTEALAALTQATRFFSEEVSRDGGYQYTYSEDLKRSSGEIRRGEETVVSVQPPGTPAVGMVYLEAYEATGDRGHLKGALAAAACLLRGQLRSGGWGYGIEFDPVLRRDHAYRVEPVEPLQKNTTVLDDNTTQYALQFLMRLDKILDFKDEAIHEAVDYALRSVLKAQQPNGAWQQRYSDPPRWSRRDKVKKASFTDDWLRVYTGVNYQGHYTFNDNSITDMIKTLFAAAKTYGDESYRKAAEKAADFILLAQLPEPQPGWAQQYDTNMHPVWARRFEPPAISGRESQDILLTLLEIYRETGKSKYLDPIPRAIDYFRRSRLSDGLVARFYEMKTNKPLYFTKDYKLTYSDEDLPTHYSFKTSDRLDGIEAEYKRLRAVAAATLAKESAPAPSLDELKKAAHEAITTLDDKGRWLNKGTIRRDAEPEPSGRVISSGTFIRNARALCEYLKATS